MPDSRRAQGKRYTLVSVLGICAAGMLAGAVSVAAVARWAREASGEVLAVFGITPHRRSGEYVAPSESTIRRVLGGVDAEAFDAAVGGWLAVQVADPNSGHGLDGHQVVVDGKTVRGARDVGGATPHLLAAMVAGQAAVIAQSEVGVKTNEITAFAPLLTDIDLTGAIVCADALHTQREHARFLVEQKQADYLFIVKENQPRLFDALNTLSWAEVPISHVDQTRGHGRHERRTIQVMDAPEDLPFPHAAQVLLIERYVTTNDSTSAVAVLGITSLGSDQADPARLAAIARAEWEIENCLHWRRDVTLAEDASTLRTRSAPRTMATLRNLTIGVLALFNWTNIKAALQWVAADQTRPLSLLGFHT